MPSQRRLVQHGPQPGRTGLGEELLASHPETGASVDLLGGRAGVGEEDDGAGVVFGLHQAVGELHLIGADDGGGLFKPDIKLEPSGQDVTVLLPPARCVGLVGECQQCFAFGLVNDPVKSEQVSHITLFGAAAPSCQAADLGGGRPDRLAGLLTRDTAGFPQSAQLRAERDPQRRRPAVRTSERPVGRQAGRRPIPCLI